MPMPVHSEATVFVVDDDEAVRDSLGWLIRSVGLRVQAYESGEAFLSDYRADRAGCLLLDMRMPGMSGLELQERLASLKLRIPVIILTAHGDVSTAVRALKAGSVDFIEKPFNDQDLLDAVHRAIARDAEARRAQAERDMVGQCFASLTAREREVLERVISGQANKAVAAGLGISEKTVEVHRARVMEKMGVRSVAELVQRVLVLRGSELP
jgi:two-component system response regulator FixJ